MPRVRLSPLGKAALYLLGAYLVAFPHARVVTLVPLFVFFQVSDRFRKVPLAHHQSPSGAMIRTQHRRAARAAGLGAP